ncbi:hypothetical protein A33M_1690 [Rhodovulum sp. PH10]|nr:hypothetical protein A33M_1690 [Rhodovulum sp. PH10]
MLATLMVTWGAAVALPGDALGPAGYRVLTELAPEPVWALVSIAIGVMRMAGLVINGRWRRSPLLRAGGAAWGLGWWLGLAWLLWLGSEPGALPALASYPVCALFEAVSVWRGAADSHRSGALGRWMSGQ